MTKAIGGTHFASFSELLFRRDSHTATSLGSNRVADWTLLKEDFFEINKTWFKNGPFRVTARTIWLP
jgi:hypothetical protein